LETVEIIIPAAASVVALIAALFIVSLRRRRQARDETSHAAAIADNLHLPASLHPVIDTDVCIGSLACIQACPEGDILGIVDGAAKLIIGTNCIGHGRCASECPVGAIKLVFGTSERGLDLPEVDGHFESSRAGVHIVGELGGMGLIKNAITQGLQVAEHLATTIKKNNDGVSDVVIVGAGPAGLATALGCREAGLTFRLLERGAFGGTIANYPRQKVVMTDKIKLPLVGTFGKKLISKEQLMASWRKIANKANLHVEEGVMVDGVAGDDGHFVVETSRGPVPGRKVVLATGRRGTPRTLGVPGEELPKVTYSLTDPDQYLGSRTLVVGGGDSALEAAISVADEMGEVALSYRGKSFGKCRESNKQKIAQLASVGKLHLLMETTVKAVEKDNVILETPRGQMTLPNDYVIACLGGELPTEFLKKAGVGIRRYYGEDLSGKAELSKKPSSARRHRHAQPEKGSYLGWYLFFTGVAIVAGLAYMGGSYYLLPKAARVKAPDHAFLKSSGLWGHGVGIAATLFMMSNFLYAARKRFNWLKGVASIKSWLTWHMFVGFMSPLVILFHSAFQSNNLIASSTYLSLLIVVGTGVVGRYIYGLVPGGGGKQAPEQAVLRAQLERQRQQAAAEHLAVRDLIDRAGSPPSEGGSLLLQLLLMPFSRLRLRLQLRGARRHFPDNLEYLDFRHTMTELLRLRLQVGFYRSLKRLLSVWRVFHVALALLLVLVMTAHIGISLYLGYRWIFR
jgi:thioredoxin reductase/NAD-dependent dihydropyrimidine dehydrogenase PreA subunit